RRSGGWVGRWCRWIAWRPAGSSATSEARGERRKDRGGARAGWESAGGREDGFDDRVVVRAPAEVADQRGAHLGGRGSGVALQQSRRAHQLTRRAVAALRCVVVHERDLERVRLPVRGQRLDRRYGVA